MSSTKLVAVARRDRQASDVSNRYNSRMLYDGYLSGVAKKFASRFDEISAHNNFELGPEYEIALCRTLRSILPSRFGICRGFIVTSDGSKAGDDIIIYNRDRFGTLRLLDEGRFDQKENIPFEAVCAYIEAKHTLYIDSESGGGQSLTKAMKQVQAVKLLKRPSVPLGYINPTLTIPEVKRWDLGWPHLANPMYAAIWSRHVKLTPTEVGNPAIISQAINATFKGNEYVNGLPDLVVAGPDVVGVPTWNGQYMSPFRVVGKSNTGCNVREGMAYGVGVASLLYALDTIQLGSMPWPHLLAEGLGVKVT